MPEFDVIHEDPKINYSSRIHKGDNGHVTVTTYRVADFTAQPFKDMREGGLDHMHKMAERVNCWVLETEEDGDLGRDIVVMRTLTPMFISNRFMISCLYHH